MDKMKAIKKIKELEKEMEMTEYRIKNTKETIRDFEEDLKSLENSKQWILEDMKVYREWLK